MVASVGVDKYGWLRSGVAGLWLVAAVPLSIASTGAVGALLGTSPALEQPPFLAAFMLVFALAGTLWARSLGRIAGRAARSLMPAGALGVAIPAGVVVLALTFVERNSDRFVRPGLPIHGVFMIAFTLAAFVLAGSGGLALGIGLRSGRATVRLGLAGGIAGAATFLIVALLFDLFGFRVGAPRAEERATMIVVSIVGMWATAIAGSAAIGSQLRNDA